jgi:hypothetical protein
MIIRGIQKVLGSTDVEAGPATYLLLMPKIGFMLW